MKRKDMLNMVLSAITAMLLVGCGASSASGDLAAGLGEAPKIKVGVGETIITPTDPVGHSMWGYNRGDNTSTGTHDDLHARSIVVEGEDGTALVMMTVSVLNMREITMDEIRKGVAQKTGIPFENVVVSSTHTHSAPRIGGPDSEYGKFFVERSVESAVKAWESRVPGRIGIGATEVFGLAMNDRRMDHGGVSPDPEAAIIKVENAAGKLMGVFFNFGAHPSTLDLHNLLFTEDWPYYSIKGIKEEIGEDVIVGYFQAAQGDVKVGYTSELSAVGAYMYDVRTFEYAEKKGRMMSEAVLRLLPTIKTSGEMVVDVTYDRFAVPLRTTYPYTHAEALRWQKEASAKLAEMEKQVVIYPTNHEEAKRWQQEARMLAKRGELDKKVGPRTLDKYKVDLWLANQAVDRSKWVEENPNPEPIKMPMQAVRLGNNLFVTFPNEIFTEIGVAVKEQSPFENTFILGVAGGHSGYIATAAEYVEGGYAVNGSPFAPEAEQVIIDSSLELISRVVDDKRTSGK